MKGRVDTTYAVSKDKIYKHRALLITKPLWNMTGPFTCHVQTFQSSDKKSAHMQVISKYNFSLYKYEVHIFYFICIQHY